MTSYQLKEVDAGSLLLVHGLLLHHWLSWLLHHWLTRLSIHSSGAWLLSIRLLHHRLLLIWLLHLHLVWRVCPWHRLLSHLHWIGLTHHRLSLHVRHARVVSWLAAWRVHWWRSHVWIIMTWWRSTMMLLNMVFLNNMLGSRLTTVNMLLFLAVPADDSTNGTTA